MVGRNVEEYDFDRYDDAVDVRRYLLSDMDTNGLNVSPT